MSRSSALDIYARVSRLGDDRQRSTDGQVADCTAVLAERGLDVGEVHIDSGRSAWNPRVRRLSWHRLMERLESGATGGAIVFDLARFSRRPIEGERLIVAAERGLLILDSEGEYDLTSASGKKAFRDQLATAAYESDRLSTRVTRGKKLKAMNGESNHSHRPFGFEQDGTTLRPDEAAEIRRLAQAFLDGASQNDLIADLNTRGVPAGQGGKWGRFALRYTLTRPRNAGYITYRGTVVGRTAVAEDDRLLTDDVYERVVAKYAAGRRGRPNSPTYLCSGIAECGHCRRTLTGRPRSHTTPYPDGTVRRQYQCQGTPGTGRCGRVAIDQRALDERVGALVVVILSDPRHAASVEAAAQKTGEDRRRLESEIAECEHLADELARRLGAGELPLARFDTASAPLERRMAGLRAELMTLESPVTLVSPEATAASRDEWFARWEGATVDVRRALIRQALQGRHLVVNSVGKTAGRFVPERIAIVAD